MSACWHQLALLAWAVLASCILGTTGQQQGSCTKTSMSLPRLAALCSSTSSPDTASAVGCGFYTLCQSASVQPALFPELCTSWRITSSLCYDDSVNGLITECIQLRELYASEASYMACLDFYPGLGRSSDVVADTVQACNDMADMDGCSLCTSATSCPTPLVAYARMCTSMYMRGCEGWEEFCSSPLTAHAGVPGAAAAALCLKPDERGGIVAPPRPPTPPAPPVAEPPPPPSVACISSPASSGCESYVYPDSSALADVARLCASMPNMPGCSLQAACTAGRISGAYCTPMTLLASVCAVDMPTMTACRNYTALCSNTSTVVAQCMKSPPVPRLPTTRVAQDALQALCIPSSTSGSTPAPSVSAACSASTCYMGVGSRLNITRCDLLSTLTTVCNSAPLNTTNDPACTAMPAWCSEAVSWAATTSAASYSSIRSYCPNDSNLPGVAPTPRPAGTLPSQPAAVTLPPVQGPGPAVPAQLQQAAAPVVTASDACVTASVSPACVSYVYPDANATADVVALCRSMPNMPGCTIQSACKAGSVSGAYCAPMTLLASICVDMATMRDCGKYLSLCSNTSVVAQCKQYPDIPRLPHTDDANNAVKRTCDGMWMSQCSTCYNGDQFSQAKCSSPLTTLSQMCAEMPTMDGCQPFLDWCDAATAWAGGRTAGGDLSGFCPAGALGGLSRIPPMLMYFHQRTEEVLLWVEWIPKTNGQYTGAFIAIMLFGVVSVGLRALQDVLLLQCAALQPAGMRPRFAYLPTRQHLMANAVRGVFTAVTTCIDLMAMLISMTFNIGYFIAVCLGYGLGAFLFSHAAGCCDRNTPRGAFLPVHVAGQVKSAAGACCGAREELYVLAPVVDAAVKEQGSQEPFKPSSYSRHSGNSVHGVFKDDMEAGQAASGLSAVRLQSQALPACCALRGCSGSGMHASSAAAAAAAAAGSPVVRVQQPLPPTSAVPTSPLCCAEGAVAGSVE